MQISKKKRTVLYITASVLAAVILVYLGISLFFSGHFYFNTIINGENYSANDVNAVQNHILDVSDHYVLEIKGRDRLADTITSADIVLRIEFGDELANIINEQNAFLWPLSLFRNSEYTVDTMVTYDKEELDRKIDITNCSDGVDGLSGTLTIITLATIYILIRLLGKGGDRKSVV